MKKTALAVIGIALLVLVGYWIHRALQSDEDRIREVIAGMAEGFNACRPGAAVDDLGADFREETTGAKREEVHQFLVGLYFSQRDPQTKDFRFRVELKDVSVHVSAEKTRADSTLRAEFSELKKGGFTPAWGIEIAAGLEKKDGAWKVRSSRHTVVTGKKPF